MDLFFDQFGPAIIARYRLQKKSDNEFGDRPCPIINCGGDDRFWINNYNGMLYHHCRNTSCDFVERTKAMQKDGVLPTDHKTDQIPYHVSKQIPLMGGAYLDGDNVNIPLTDVSLGEKRGTQTIKPNSSKLYSKGMKKEGSGCFIGEKSNILYVCEGWATAVTVHMATGEQALFALDAKTLVKTVKRLQHSKIIIAGDNDPEGIAAAEKANFPYVLPEKDGWDWWDVFNAFGEEGVNRQIKKVHNQVHNSKEFTLDAYDFLTGCELTDKIFKPLEFVYDKIIPTPNLVLLAGAPKLGKSWFAFLLIEQLTKTGYKVVYLANEDSDQRLQTRYNQVTDIPSNDVVFFGALSNDKKIPKGKDAHLFLRAIKKKFNPKVIIIDTMAAIRSPYENENYATVEQEFSTLRHLAHDIDIVIICVHHTKKKTDYDVEPLDSILGSQAIAGTAETILIMQSMVGTKDVNLFVTGKEVEQQDLTLPWKYPGYDEPILAIFAGLGHAQQEVLDYIKEHPRCTQAAIVQELGKSKAQISEICGKLITKELIRKNYNSLLMCI